MRTLAKLKGIILDFDGLIFDTETPELVAWSEIFQDFGINFPEAEYLNIVGQAVDDAAPLQILSRFSQISFDPASIMQKKRQKVLELLKSQEVLPGVNRLLKEAKSYNLKIGLASNSDPRWVLNHLNNLRIRDFFACVKTSNDVINAKPDPSLYLETLKCLNLQTNEVIAFEDSLNGVTAAVKAGIFTVAVPNRVTQFMDFSSADLICRSLDDFSLLNYLQYKSPHEQTRI